ncbi:MAG TPA: TIGR00341 family protein [Spirochaetota bacterium]|nr:TIGR00341 family protein [Spirochaetota bacterium]HPJ35439.1 TIGR00341 family protein [Spirochaetota bacterium]
MAEKFTDKMSRFFHQKEPDSSIKPEPAQKEKSEITSQGKPVQKKEPQPENKTRNENETGEKTKEKKNARIDDLKNFMGHVIEPEERTLKNYMDIGFWKSKRELYKGLREKEKQDQNVYQNLFNGASPTIEYYILTVLSCLIATTGLLQGSTATIIGAMIVAPLMTPILAFSLGVIWGDIPLIRTSAFSLFKGIMISLFISSALAFLIPMEGYSTEITARTSPTIFDIIVAFASGLVGAYGSANKRISNTLVGIAIAVALMPPLCTIGIGIGTLNKTVASGAALLFLINLVSISLAGAIVFWGMEIHPIAAEDGAVRKRAIYQILISIIILTTISIPVFIYMKHGFLISRATRTAGEIIQNELPDVSLIELKMKEKDEKFRFTATISGSEKPDSGKNEAIIQKAAAADSRIGGIKLMFIKTAEIESAEGADLNK